MDKKIYGLPGSVVIIGLVYAVALALAPAPGLSAPTAETIQTESEPSNAATGRSTPPLAMQISDGRTGYLGAHATLAPVSVTCAHISDAAVKYATRLHIRYLQPHRRTTEREPAIGSAPPGKLTFF